MLSTAIRNAIYAWVQGASGLDINHVVWVDSGNVPSGTYITIDAVGSGSIGQDANDAELNPLVIADNEIVFWSPSSDYLELNDDHGLSVGDGPFIFTGPSPGHGLEVGEYWIIPKTVNQIYLATSFQNAIDNVIYDIPATPGGSIGYLSSQSTTVSAGAEILNYARGPRSVSLELRCYVDDAAAVGQAISILESVKTKATLPTTLEALNTAGIGLGTFSPVSKFAALVNRTVMEPRALLDVTLWLAVSESENGTIIEQVNAVNDPVFS